MIRLSLLFLWVPFLSAGAERPPLTQPSHSAVILESSRHPVLATWMKGKVFYSDWHESEECLGKDLYLLDPSKRSEEILLAKHDCITRISSDGNNVWVSVTQGGVPATLRWDGNGLQEFYDALRALYPVATAKLKAKVRELGLKNAAPILVDAGATIVSLLYYHEKEGKGANPLIMLDVGGMDSNVTVFGTYLNQKAFPPEVAFSRGGDGKLYMTDRSHPMGRLLYFHRKDSTSTGMERYYFHDDTQRLDFVPDKVASAKWAVRAPYYFAATPKSFVIFDRTPHDFEQKILSYYEPTTAEMFRVALPEGVEMDIGGVAYAEEGLLISHPGARRITWYGREIPAAIRNFLEKK